MINHTTQSELPTNAQGGPFDAKITHILALIHPDVIWSKIDDPLTKISDQWPRPVNCPAHFEGCCRLLANYFNYLQQHWLHVSISMPDDMASAMVAGILEPRGGFTAHLTRLLSEGGGYLDAVVAVIMAHQIEDATERYVTFHVLQEWEPYNWDFHLAFVQRYLEAYHLLDPNAPELLREQLLNPLCRPWEHHCVVLRHLRQRRNELMAISAPKRKDTHAM